ncbi:hypothetical protein [Variovorax sp. JS1663]|uniref:hypothetical protein n=1 Tax=Variovorax sp. JS1663 TaxID=1851577 RepID=UPI000B755F0E|nr:hypothetical protein [Variovorax sp. JS1663]OUM04446.1 hypothetical protein A8M77_01705 [Variovorax sp. JS1663]
MPRMLRPKSVVLPESAVVPEANVKPPPRRFTHEVIADQAFHFAAGPADAPPDGHFAAGTRVLLLERGEGPMCFVQDRQGLCAFTAFAGLRALGRG